MSPADYSETLLHDHPISLNFSCFEGLIDASGQKVVDIGCGTGEVEMLIASLFSKIYAVDISKEMINVSRERLKQFSNIVYFVTSGASLSCVQDQSVDLVFAESGVSTEINESDPRLFRRSPTECSGRTDLSDSTSLTGSEVSRPLRVTSLEERRSCQSWSSGLS